MKKILLGLGILVASCNPAFSQWNLDPNNPMVVAQLNCVQNGSKVVSDNNGGAFIFWIDTRDVCQNNGPAAVYGQHYDMNGYKLWETDGRLIASYASAVSSVAVVRSAFDGEMVLGFHTRYEAFGDSLRFQKFDDDGNPLWSQDLLIARSDGCSGYYVLGIENFSFLRTENGEYTVNFTPVYCGGANGNRITRFNSDGVLTGPYMGEPESNQYYVGSRGIERTYDGSNDVYLYHTGGNGAGAHAFCMRVTAAGDSAWAPIDVLDGTNGLNYQYGALSDPNGITFCFMSNGPTSTVDLFMRRLNSDGTWAWNANTVEVCVYDGNQSNFHMVRDDEYIYVVWADGRPGVIGYSAIYAQKISLATGEIQWAEDGVLIFDQNTYIPYPKCELTEDGNLMVMNESTMVDAYFNAQLVDPSGNTQWTEIVSLASNLFAPFYQQYQMLNSNGNMIVVWDASNPGGGADGVYISRIVEPDMTTYISETVTACDSYTINGTDYTESGSYEIALPGDTLLTLNLTIISPFSEITLSNGTLYAVKTSGTLTWIDCDSGDVLFSESSSYTPELTGTYALVVEESACADTSNCLYVKVLGMDEIPGTDDVSIFPNPAHDFITLRTESALNQARVKITTTEGKTVRVIGSLSGSGNQIQIDDLAAGVYFIEIFEDQRTSRMQFIVE